MYNVGAMAADLYHFPIDSAEIRRELYSLMALLFADEKMAELAERQEGFDYLSDQVLRLLLPLKFLTVSAAVRGVLDDITGSDPSQKRYDGGHCGSYFADGTKEEGKVELSLRRACNCAIHAERTLFYSDEVSHPARLRVFNGEITLYGSHRDRERPGWKAVIGLEKFAAECLASLTKAAVVE